MGGVRTKQILIYDNICRRAKEVGISINAIEKETGLAIGSICKWNSVSPSVRSLSKVAQVLKCSVNDLLSSK